jgi:hypothetical protein
MRSLTNKGVQRDGRRPQRELGSSLHQVAVEEKALCRALRKRSRELGACRSGREKPDVLEEGHPRAVGDNGEHTSGLRGSLTCGSTSDHRGQS